MNTQPSNVPTCQRSHARTPRWLLLIVVLSTLLRLGAAVYLGDTVEVLPGTYDQVTYDALARRMLVGAE